MDVLPANRPLKRKDAFFMLILLPLETVTASLRRGDEWELRDLTEVANRCRALAAAFDMRMEEIEPEKPK